MFFFYFYLLCMAMHTVIEYQEIAQVHIQSKYLNISET